MTLARDAVLAVLVLAVVVAAATATATAVAPLAVLAGALGAVTLELLASTRACSVHRAWTRPVVRWSAVGVAVVLVALVAVLFPERGLNALAGGLVAYLALVVLVALGVLPPTTAWRSE